MKKLAVLFASMFIFAIAVQNVNAQTSAVASDVPAAALIITPIAISITNDGLNFGTLVPSGNDGTVTVPPTGDRTASNVGFISQESDFSAAAFNVTGEIGYTFSLTLPEDDVITLVSDLNSMDVNSFTASIGASANAINSGGTSFTVGATLSVGGAQPAGLYEGEFDVTVAYE